MEQFWLELLSHWVEQAVSLVLHAFYGDGSNLDGVASAGLGTALAETQPGQCYLLH